MKKVFICEFLCKKPFDEGCKKAALSMVKEFVKDKECQIIAKNGSDYNEPRIEQLDLNKLFLNGKFLREIKEYAPAVIYYLAAGSITLPGMLRAKILQYFNKHSSLVFLAIQQRKYPWYFVPLAKLFKPKLVLVFSPQHEEYLRSLNFKVRQIPLGVDTSQFKPVAEVKKNSLRDKYGIPQGKFVLVHVGHLKGNRNIESLLGLQSVRDLQLLIVGSTSTEQETNIKDKLICAGAAIIDWYLDEIEEIYQLADAYIFPVREETAAISLPLSVLEAMACNLPVITTRFGGLIEHFPETPDFRYYDEDNTLPAIIKDISTVNSKNRERVKGFSWDSVVKEMEAISQSLLNTD